MMQVGLSGVPGGPHVGHAKPTSSQLYPTPARTQDPVLAREGCPAPCVHEVRLTCQGGRKGISTWDQPCVVGTSGGMSFPTWGSQPLADSCLWTRPKPCWPDSLGFHLPWKPRHGGSISDQSKLARLPSLPAHTEVTFG